MEGTAVERLAYLQTTVHTVRFTHNENALRESSITVPLLLGAHICNVYVSGGYKSSSNRPHGFQSRLLVINCLFPFACLSRAGKTHSPETGTNLMCSRFKPLACVPLQGDFAQWITADFNNDSYDKWLSICFLMSKNMHLQRTCHQNNTH